MKSLVCLLLLLLTLHNARGWELLVATESVDGSSMLYQVDSDTGKVDSELAMFARGTLPRFSSFAATNPLRDDDEDLTLDHELLIGGYASAFVQPANGSPASMRGFQLSYFASASDQLAALFNDQWAERISDTAAGNGDVEFCDAGSISSSESVPGTLMPRGHFFNSKRVSTSVVGVRSETCPLVNQCCFVAQTFDVVDGTLGAAATLPIYYQSPSSSLPDGWLSVSPVATAPQVAPLLALDAMLDRYVLYVPGEPAHFLSAPAAAAVDTAWERAELANGDDDFTRFYSLTPTGAGHAIGLCAKKSGSDGTHICAVDYRSGAVLDNAPLDKSKAHAFGDVVENAFFVSDYDHHRDLFACVLKAKSSDKYTLYVLQNLRVVRTQVLHIDAQRISGLHIVAGNVHEESFSVGPIVAVAFLLLTPCAIAAAITYWHRRKFGASVEYIGTDDTNNSGDSDQSDNQSGDDDDLDNHDDDDDDEVFNV